jgi:phosphoribosylglycinamide formyltransferase 1
VRERVKTAILISGRGSNMSALIAAASDARYPAEVVLVLSDKSGAAGLGAARASGVAAHALDFKSFSGKETFEAAVDAELRAAGIELVCLAGFMRILSANFVAKWQDRILNIHPSLLPDLRGLHTHERAIAERRSEHGCTVHVVSAELDAGPIVAQARAPVLEGDDATSLAARVLVEEHRLYPEALATVARSFRAA